MKRAFVLALGAALLLLSQLAAAHRIDEYLQATQVAIDAGRVRLSMRLIPGTLVASEVIAAIDSDGDGAFSDAEQRCYAERVLGDLTLGADGDAVRPRLTSWRFPSAAEMRAGSGEIQVDYEAPLRPASGTRRLILENHHLPRASVYLMNALLPQDVSIRILAQKRNPQQSSYEVDYLQAPAASTGGWAQARDRLAGVQFSSLFQLGVRHIAEGTDHLLFLLVLLLPAPLRAARRRWDAPVATRTALLRILGIVTAFTVGHSVTLMLGALGIVVLPARPVEASIALSILVSAVHAIRPLFPGREAWIAAFFGLIHGLAFAATLDHLGLGMWERSAGILAFNLGIEAMQTLVVAAVLPSLLLMGATAVYPVLRIGGAALAGIAAALWLLERVLDLHTPVDKLMDGLARHGAALAAVLFLASLLCRTRRTPADARRTRTPAAPLP